MEDFQTQYSQSYTFFSNQSSSLPIKLDFGPTFFTFNVRSIYNGSFLSNFNINIFDPYSHNEILNRSVINNASGSTFIFQGPRYYDIQVNFSDILRSQIIFLTQDMNITLDLDTGILLTLLNSTTNQFISGATIKAFDLNNNPLNPVVIFKDNSYRILLPPSKINLFVQKGVFNRTDTIIIPNTSPIPLQLYLGTVNVTLSAQTDVPVLANWTIIGGNSPIQKLNQFNIVFQAYSGTNYTIQIQYSNITDIFQLTPEQTISQTIFLKNNYSLTFQIINGTQENHTPLNNATIKLKSSSISKTLSTNSTGLANIIFQEMDVFNATIIYISSNGQVYTYSFLINSPNYYDRIIQIPLGMIRLVLNTTAIDNIPIPNENIILYLQRNNSISTISTHTNSTGQLDLLIPLVDSITITNGFFEHTFIINQSQIVQLSFLHIKTSSITFNVIDLNGVPIPNSQLQIIPISNLNLVEQIVIYTDNNGQAKISWPWGEYRIIATYQNIQHEETIVINANTNIFNLQFLFYLSSLGANDYLQINAFRNIQVSNPSQYANQFLQTTFTIFFVTILISVFIIVILSLFSLESIITFPIYQHRREIGTLRLLGTQPIDVSIGVSLKLALYSVVACIIGSICTEILTSTFLTIGSSNIGGFIFEPKFDLLISLLLFATVFISTFLISFIYMMRNITNKL